MLHLGDRVTAPFLVPTIFTTKYAPVMELVDMRDLGAVTSVKVSRLGFDQQLLVQDFPHNKVIYVQTKIRDFIALYALKSQTDIVSPQISHFSNSSFYF